MGIDWDAADEALEKLLEFHDLDDPFGAADGAATPLRVPAKDDGFGFGFGLEVSSRGVDPPAVDARVVDESQADVGILTQVRRKRDREGIDAEQSEGRARRDGRTVLSGAAGEARDSETGAFPREMRSGSIDIVCGGRMARSEGHGINRTPAGAVYSQRMEFCTGSGDDRDGQRSEAVVSLSSEGISAARDQDLGDGARRGGLASASAVSTVLGYRIPGPAGSLQTPLSKNGVLPRGPQDMDRNFGPGRPCDEALLTAEALDFREGPWLAAMEFLNDGDPNVGKRQSRSTIATIKATKRHIPQIAALVKTVVPNGFGDVSVTLKDPTGTMNGNVHRRVLAELEDGHLVTPGAVLILRKVAVFSPTPTSHYLNITVNNVDRIFGKDTIAVRNAGTIFHSNRNGHASNLASGHFGPQTSFHDRSRAPAIVTGVQEQETIAEHKGKNAERSCGAAVNGIFSEPSDGGNLLGEMDAQTKATHEAIARTAGWNFSEDIELLLAEDFPF